MPFQAAQYAGTSCRLNTIDTPRVSEDLHRAPLPSPFDDHPEEATVPVSSTSVPAPAVPREQQPGPDAQRPVSAYTVYEGITAQVCTHTISFKHLCFEVSILHIPRLSIVKIDMHRSGQHVPH